MYLDRLDGRISAALYDSKSQQWLEEQKQIELRMRQLETAPIRTAAEAVQIIRSVSDTCRTFQHQPAEQQRTLAASVMEKDLGGRKVRVDAENALPDFAALELGKYKRR